MDSYSDNNQSPLIILRQCKNSKGQDSRASWTRIFNTIKKYLHIKFSHPHIVPVLSEWEKQTKGCLNLRLLVWKPTSYMLFLYQKKQNKTLSLALWERQAFRGNKFTNTVSNDIPHPVIQGYEKQMKLKLAYYKISARIILFFHISGS